MLSTLHLHPALFARAWLNLMPVAKMSDEFENAIVLEEHETGVWLVAMAPTAWACCWVPFDPAVETPPSFRQEPVAPPVLIGDGDGQILARCKYEWKRWKKNAADAGDDEFFVISPTAAEPKPGKTALPGLERINVRVRTLDWHQDTIEVQKPVPDWRETFRNIGHGQREQIMLSMETLKALTAIEGCRDPRVEFGDGARALLTFEPAEGIRPVTFVWLAVGKREEGPKPDAFDRLVQQSFDESTGSWSDDGEDDEGDDDDPAEMPAAAVGDDPSLQLAERAAQTALASLIRS